MKFSLQLISGGPAQDFMMKPIFDEPTIALRHHLTALGHEVSNDATGTTPIILNFHCIPTRFNLSTMPLKGAIIYNQESYGNHAERWTMAAIAAHAHGAKVWDLRQENVAHWRQDFGVEAKYVPVGWAPEMGIVPQYSTKPIDLLLYGVCSERRRKIMEYVRSHGYITHLHYGGPSKESIMGLSKIILSARAFDNVTQVETIRLIHAAGNNCLCACESGTESMGLEGGMIWSSYDNLGKDIVEWLTRHEDDRSALAAQGQRLAQDTGQAMQDHLAEALE